MRNERYDYHDDVREAELVDERNEGDLIAARTFLNRVYNWMAVGLALTGAIAYYVYQYMLDTRPVMNHLTGELSGGSIFWSGGFMLVMILVEFGLVIWLSAGINRMSASTATFLFLAYAAINGITLAPIFLTYTASSIYTAFFACAGTFAVTSIFGYVTRMDLSGVGSFCMMGLFGIIIASLVNFFMHSEGLDQIITYVGVFIFIGLTAWDTQKLKQLGGVMDERATVYKKFVILGALELYLDFVNLFLMLLRIFGDRK